MQTAGMLQFVDFWETRATEDCSYVTMVTTLPARKESLHRLFETQLFTPTLHAF
jgi:hypothetical protein